jgi:hypothetical protein
VVIKVFGHQTEDVDGRFGRLYTEERHELHSLPNTGRSRFAPGLRS